MTQCGVINSRSDVTGDGHAHAQICNEPGVLRMLPLGYQGSPSAVEIAVGVCEFHEGVLEGVAAALGGTDDN